MLVYHVILYMFSDIKCNHSALQFGAEGVCRSYASWRMSTSFFKTLCASVRVSTSQFREVRTITDMKLSAKWEPGARAFSTISAQHATLPLKPYKAIRAWDKEIGKHSTLILCINFSKQRNISLYVQGQRLHTFQIILHIVDQLLRLVGIWEMVA